MLLRKENSVWADSIITNFQRRAKFFEYFGEKINGKASFLRLLYDGIGI
jgi:hypothetical protein